MVVKVGDVIVLATYPIALRDAALVVAYALGITEFAKCDHMLALVAFQDPDFRAYDIPDEFTPLFRRQIVNPVLHTFDVLIHVFTKMLVMDK